MITDNNKTANREVVRELSVWCQDNNLSPIVSKTKELIVDYKKRLAEQALINLDRAVEKRVESFKFLGVHITNELAWSKHTKTVVKSALQHFSPLRRLKRFGMGPHILKVIQLQHEEHPDWLRHRLVWQLLGIGP